MLGITWLYRKLFCRKGFGVHSPFVFDLITNVIGDTFAYYSFKDISLIRKKLIKKGKSVFCKGRQLTVKKAIRQYGTSTKEGEFLFRLTNRYKPRKIIAFGSSLGLTPLYLSRYDSTVQCVTFESEPDFAKTAARLLKKETNSSLQIRTGSYRELACKITEKFTSIDCIIFDKNIEISDIESIFNHFLPYIHAKTFWVLADIRSSIEKKRFWEQMCRHPRVTVAVDLYQMGLLFVDPKLRKRVYKSII